MKRIFKIFFAKVQGTFQRGTVEILRSILNGSFTSKVGLIKKELDQTVVKFKNKKGEYKILKTPIYYSGIFLCLLVLFMFTFISAGCKKEEPNVPISSQNDTLLIPSQNDTLQTTQDTTYALVGTKWKLVEFVQISEGTTKIPTKFSFKRNSYWIMFNNDSSLDGCASTNKMNGSYQMDIQTSTIRIDVGYTTYINEHPDGGLYIECLNLASSFEVITTFLKLYYNETDYLLFNAYDDEN
jgi:hypothetical protein